MSFLLIPKTDIYYPSNVSDIYMNWNVTDIYLNWNGIFFFENDIDFITHLTLGLQTLPYCLSLIVFLKFI